MENGKNARHALVCGGTQGIGKATAFALAEQGVRITLLARDEAKLRAVSKELPPIDGGTHDHLVADLSDPTAFGPVISEFAAHGPIDILVNNTGGPPPGPAHEADIATYAAAFALHLLSFQTLVRAIVPGMKARGHGRIINVISTSVKQPLSNLGVSNTIRGAVASWGKTLANELGPFGITVNNVLPGATETERLHEIIRNKAKKTQVSEEVVKDEMLSEIPLHRFARPEEIAAAIAFLAGPSGGYINGINLPVDGGRTRCL